MKRKLFSKFKDYNNILEEILEKKYFMVDTKNLLLSMVYKIETSYNDYKKVKVNCKSKDEVLNNIINIINVYCNEIKLCEPNSQEANILKKHNVLAVSNETGKSIISYPTEMALLYALSDMRPKYFYIKTDYVFKDIIQKMLVEGYNQNNVEILKNFNGWSWNNEVSGDILSPNSIMYQSLLILLGHEFLEKWLDDSSGRSDYIKKMHNILISKYEEYGIEIFISLIRNLLLNNRTENLDEKIEASEKKYREILDKDKFVSNIKNQKKKMLENLMKLETILESESSILSEMKKRNTKLKADMKIKDGKEMLKILEKDKRNYLRKIEELEKFLLSSNLDEYIKNVQIEYNCFKEIKESKRSKELERFLLLTLKCLEKKIEKSSSKEEIIDIIYELRYFKNMYYKAFKNKLQTVEKSIENLLKRILTKACKNTVLNIYSMNINDNFEIISHVFDTKIIDLEEVRIVLEINKEDVIEKIYDKEILEKEINLGLKVNLKDITIKKNKPIKLFI